VPAERLVVTGSIQGDDMYRCGRLDTRALADVRCSIGVAADRPYLLYALDHVTRLPNVAPQTARNAIETILRAMKTAFPHLPRVVKLHPKQGEDDRSLIHSGRSASDRRARPRQSGELVAAAAVVVSTVSSSLLWAVGIDRAGGQRLFLEGADEQRQVRINEGVEHADTFNMLVAALRSNVENPEHVAHWKARRHAARQIFLQVDGRSAERIATKLLSLLS